MPQIWSSRPRVCARGDVENPRAAGRWCAPRGKRGKWDGRQATEEKMKGCHTETVWRDDSIPFFFFFLMFIFERAGKKASVGKRQREGGQRIRSGPYADSREPGVGLEPWDQDLSQSGTLNWLNHPGAPGWLHSMSLPLYPSASPERSGSWREDHFLEDH